MRPTDQILARYSTEIEDRQTFIDGLVEGAENESRDLTAQEMELVTRARTRLGELNAQIEPLKEARRISVESAERLADLGKLMGREDEKPRTMEYRTAGEYVLDRWQSGLGNRQAAERLELYHRAAAHQLTT